MATITLKNVPDPLYETLKRTAKANRRSINAEAIRCLERVLEPRRMSAQEFLERAKEIRRKHPNIYVTEEELNRWKREGRR